MPSLRFPRLRAIVTYAGDYKPGDPPPEGYLEWHEWAEVQRCAPGRRRWRMRDDLATD